LKTDQFKVVSFVAVYHQTMMLLYQYLEHYHKFTNVELSPPLLTLTKTRNFYPFKTTMMSIILSYYIIEKAYL